MSGVNLERDFSKEIRVVEYDSTESMQEGLRTLSQKHRYLKYDFIYNCDTKKYVVTYEYIRRKTTLN